MKGRAMTCIVLGTVFALATLAPAVAPGGADETVMGTPAGWTHDIRLTNNLRPDTGPSIAAYFDNIYTVYKYQAFGYDDVYFLKSSDAGRNWESPVRLSRGISDLYCESPDIGINQGNNIHVVWDDNDDISTAEIRYKNSTDGGITWGSEKMISTNDNYRSEGPKIAVSEGGQSTHVVWVDSRHGAESSPPNTELYYTRSLDGGVTWEPEVRLTNALYYSSYNRIAVTGSTVHLLWSDARYGITKGDLFYKVSYDNGATWGSDSLLAGTSNSEVDGAIAVNGTCVHIAWGEYSAGPAYNIYYGKSIDNGMSWNPAYLVVDSGTAINPSIKATANEIHLAWNDWRYASKNEIYYINSTDGGSTWNPEIRLTMEDGFQSAGPKLAISGPYRHIIWDDQRDGNQEIYYKRYPDFPASANLTLSHGWNLISFPVEQPALNGTPITNASSLCEATGCTNTAKWNATNQNYTNYIAGFDNPGEPNDFTIGENDGIWLWWNGTGEANYSITGYEPGHRNVHLLPGWNVIAYKSATPGDVETMWASQVQCDIYDDICYWDGQTFRHYIFPTTEMELTPTRGYFVWSDIDTYLSY